MGLSASQARLLSITQRLNNNEMEAEIIAMQKMHLADRNTAACSKYINALDATKYDYISYNDTGIQESVALTFSAINQYSPLKNQYALFNNEDQIYVSAKDAENFKNSTNMYDFLTAYGVFDRSNAEFEESMREFREKYADYEAQQQDYDNQLAEFNTQYHNYREELEAYNNALDEYNRLMEEYNQALAAPKLYGDFTAAVVSNSHYTAAKGGDPGCFLHVLNKLIDYNGQHLPYDTSASGVKLTELFEVGYYAMPELQPISDAMWGDNEDRYICDAHDVGTDGTKNLLQIAREAGRAPSTMEILASDFLEIDKGDGTYDYQLKTLKQKSIDMYYLIANSSEQYSSRSGAGANLWALTDLGISVQTILEDYVEGDMKGLDPEPPEEVPPFEGEMPTFSLTPPQEPEEPVYTDKIYDKPLAQWLTNLWNLMDGNPVSEEISSVYDEDANFSHYTFTNKEKTSISDLTHGNKNKNYIVINDKDASDEQWLHFAFQNGLIHLGQARLTKEINGSRITWQGLELTSTSDIKEVQDTSKIAKAEAEYKSSLYEIQSEDKKFDAEMKKLDTEHSAFQKEIESIKGVMSKNVEKSFTVFS